MKQTDEKQLSYAAMIVGLIMNVGGTYGVWYQGDFWGQMGGWIRGNLNVDEVYHSDQEDRWVDIGFSSKGRLVVVWYTERGECMRLIGCRKATPRERDCYTSINRPDDTIMEMRTEYDFSKGERGKHFRAYRSDHTVRVTKADGSVDEHHFSLEDGAVMLDPDLRDRFPDSESVNRALRTLIAHS